MASCANCAIDIRLQGSLKKVVVLLELFTSLFDWGGPQLPHESEAILLTLDEQTQGHTTIINTPTRVMGSILHPPWRGTAAQHYALSVSGDTDLMREHLENRESQVRIPNLIGLSGGGRYGPHILQNQTMKHQMSTVKAENFGWFHIQNSLDRLSLNDLKETSGVRIVKKFAWVCFMLVDGVAQLVFVAHVSQ